MSVSAVSNQNSLANLWQLLQTQASTAVQALNGGATSSSGTAATSATSSGVQTSISQAGQTIGQLAQLAQSNPTEFAQLTGNMATALQNLANNTTDPNQKAYLDQLATQFQTASQTGNVSSLMPKGHHHHHHGGAAPTSSSTSGQDSTSTLGVVSGASGSASTTSAASNSVQQQLLSLFQSFDSQVASAYGTSAAASAAESIAT